MREESDGASSATLSAWNRFAIEHEVVSSRGQAYVVWDRSKGDLVREFMEGRGC